MVHLVVRRLRCLNSSNLANSISFSVSSVSTEKLFLGSLHGGPPSYTQSYKDYKSPNLGSKARYETWPSLGAQLCR